MSEMSDYEKRALKEIQNWKNPKLTWYGKTMQYITWPINKAGDKVIDMPAIGWVIKKTVSGIVSISNDFAQWSLRPDAIYEEFRQKGYEKINGKTDILSLDLEEVDFVIGYLGAKYKGIALAEGATTGSIGLPGIPPDILALVSINLRAIGEYAVYTGFDPTSQHERLYAMNILSLASSPQDSSKAIAMAQMVKIAKDVAKKKAWKDLEKYTFVKIIQRIAKSLGVRLTKAKLAQVIPYTGALVGGGFNIYYTAKVCDEAYFNYRERFLAAKYGEDVIETIVNPAENYISEYEDHIDIEDAIDLDIENDINEEDNL